VFVSCGLAVCDTRATSEDDGAAGRADGIFWLSLRWEGRRTRCDLHLTGKRQMVKSCLISMKEMKILDRSNLIHLGNRILPFRGFSDNCCHLWPFSIGLGEAYSQLVSC